MTRAESIKETEKRRKAGAYKREQRAKLTTRQKEEINRKREKARKEREMLLEFRRRRKEQLEQEKLERLKKKTGREGIS
ncbi:hypothetical protein HOLleu_00728 [Holothuria leucospilota]|uniref:Uncharacterized protein n=1 Tax=Holothuria leucospilota TaxID=206669 RepID=A0A9Q1HG05_HOLLE|nr:hypothetical protein HOLleu_00728 [Holothuria leucospilota]